MSEWSKELASKASSSARGSWVRIPLSPPTYDLRERPLCGRLFYVDGKSGVHFICLRRHDILSLVSPDQDPTGSHAAETPEPCQILTEAALRESFRAMWECLVGSWSGFVISIPLFRSSSTAFMLPVCRKMSTF